MAFSVSNDYLPGRPWWDRSPYARSMGKTKRTWPVWLMCVLLGFTGITAIGGGIEMLIYPQGNEFVPEAWLADIPIIDSWVVPGLFLLVVLGAGSLFTAYGLFRGQRRGWLATIALGVALIAWIGLEVVFLPERSFLEALYAGIGIILLGLAALPSVRTRFAAEAASRAERHVGSP